MTPFNLSAMGLNKGSKQPVQSYSMTNDENIKSTKWFVKVCVRSHFNLLQTCSQKKVK